MASRSRKPTFVVAALLVASTAVGAVLATAQRDGSRTLYGPAAAVGAGTARLFIDLGADGKPDALGVALTETALSGLAQRMNTTSRCFDKNGSGHAEHGECLGDYQTDLELPARAAGIGLPVRWATVNWNPEGHPDPAPPVWSAPHFDFHFFMADRAVITAIRPGPCGEFIDCEDFAIATKPLPAAEQPEDYIDVGAAVPAMGNHLVDSKDPELLDPSLGFTRTLIYGAYDGRMIFVEPMVSKAFLATRPNVCAPVKAPRAWAVAGYYPTRYCVRFRAADSMYLVTLEGLVRRQPSTAGP